MAIAEESVAVAAEIVALIELLADLALVDGAFWNRRAHEFLTHYDAALWQRLGELLDGSLRHDVGFVTAAYSEDQLSAFGEEGYPKFTQTGILVHYSRDSEKGLRVVGRGYEGTEISSYCHVQTNKRWACWMTMIEAAARLEYEAHWKEPEGPWEFLLPPDTPAERAAPRQPAAGVRRRTRIRATPHAPKYVAFAKAARKRNRTGKTLEQISHEIFGTKTRKAAKPKIERCREWIKGNKPKLKWWGVSDT